MRDQPPTQTSFDHIVTAYASDLARYLARQVRDSCVAEDLLQETLIRIARALPGFEGRSSVKTWAFAIATRVAIDHFRRSAGLPPILDLSEADTVADPARQPDEGLAVARMNECVREVVASLPEDYRKAITLHDFAGLSAREIADTCGCSEANAKVRIHRARARLKAALQQQCELYHDGEHILRCCRKD